MAEELQEVEAQEVEAEQAETDWKAKYESMREHMRDWEKKAKANQSAADELEQLKAAQMTEQEKAIARAEQAEAELATFKAEAERVDTARQISTDTGVPFELLMYCSDSEAMADFAKKYQSEQPHVSAAASATRSRIIRGNSDGARSHGDLFADAVSDLF